MNKNKKVEYEFKNEVTDNKIILTLSGTVCKPNFLNFNTIYCERIRKCLQEHQNKDVVIRLNSGGGDVFEGIEIYNYLKTYPQHVTVEVMALAGSAASIICMGADKVVMKTGSTMMIHEASTVAFGNKADILKTLKALETIDKSIVTIYCKKTGKTEEEINTLVIAETWFTAEEAKSFGFADEIAEDVKKDTPQEKTKKIEKDEEDDFSNAETVVFNLPKNENKEQKEIKKTALQNIFLGGKNND